MVRVAAAESNFAAVTVMNMHAMHWDGILCIPSNTSLQLLMYEVMLCYVWIGHLGDVMLPRQLHQSGNYICSKRS